MVHWLIQGSIAWTWCAPRKPRQHLERLGAVPHMCSQTKSRKNGRCLDMCWSIKVLHNFDRFWSEPHRSWVTSGKTITNNESYTLQPRVVLISGQGRTTTKTARTSRGELGITVSNRTGPTYNHALSILPTDTKHPRSLLHDKNSDTGR